MTDKLTPEQRRRCMQGNTAKGTRIEVVLGRELWHRGLRYRKNDKSVIGTPDFSFKGRKLAVFCDGEFWHGRNWSTNKARIKSNTSYWHAKIERNIERDLRVNQQLESAGWNVLRFWESDIRKHPQQCADEIEEAWRASEIKKLRSTYSYDTQYDTPIAAEEEEEYNV